MWDFGNNKADEPRRYILTHHHYYAIEIAMDLAGHGTHALTYRHIWCDRYAECLDAEVARSPRSLGWSCHTCPRVPRSVRLTSPDRLLERMRAMDPRLFVVPRSRPLTAAYYDACECGARKLRRRASCPTCSRVALVCPVCEEEYHVPRWIAARRRTCSKRCRGVLSQRKQMMMGSKER